MKWITRERPKIDRIACPWLIARFIDKTPEFLFAPARGSLCQVRYRRTSSFGSASLSIDSSMQTGSTSLYHLTSTKGAFGFVGARLGARRSHLQNAHAAG